MRGTKNAGLIQAFDEICNSDKQLNSKKIGKHYLGKESAGKEHICVMDKNTKRLLFLVGLLDDDAQSVEESIHYAGALCVIDEMIDLLLTIRQNETLSFDDIEKIDKIFKQKSRVMEEAKFDLRINQDV